MGNYKYEILDTKQIQNTNKQNPKQYDLENRTLRFARSTVKFLNKVPKTVVNMEIMKQLIRSSGSVGANYIEANESLSKKDFQMRIKICRKEAKESIYWLKLLEINNSEIGKEREILIKEATEIMKIFGAIIEKCKQ